MDVCDRFIGLSVKDIEEYLSICNYIDDKEYEENFRIIPNCEGVHLAYLKKTGLENKKLIEFQETNLLSH